RDQFRPVAGSVQDAQAQLPQLQLRPVAQWAEGIRNLGRLVQAQFGLLGRGQPARPGDVVGVDVRVNDVAQAEVAFAEQCLVRLGVDGRVDDGRFAGLARGDHIRRTPTAFVQDLLEVHDCALRWRACRRSLQVYGS